MKVLFICGPYRANTPSKIVENIRHAEKYAKKYWQLGYAVICPHTNSALFDGLCEDEVWLKGYQEILSRCDVVVCIPGWENSAGSLVEERRALQLQLVNRFHNRKEFQIIYEKKENL